VTLWLAARACLTASIPVWPVAPMTAIFILFLFSAKTNTGVKKFAAFLV
jgi:hypothetical protein